MGDVDMTNQLTTSYCFLRRTLKWWKKYFFWGLEISLVNAYISYKEKTKNQGTKLIAHRRFRDKILSMFTRDSRFANMKLGKPGTYDKHDPLDGKPYFILVHPTGERFVKRAK